MPTAMYTKAISSTVKLKARVNLKVRMVMSIRENGKKTNPTVLEQKPGKTVRNTKGLSWEAKKRAEEKSVGQMNAVMKAIGKTTRCTAQVTTYGQMEWTIKVTGEKAKSMVEAF